LKNITGAEDALSIIFNPQSIAVIGASGRPGALSWVPLHLLQRYGYKGAIYPINPTRQSIDGIVCYPSLADLPGPVDVAIVPLNAAATPDAVHQCAEAGVRAVVLPAQGLGEQGGEGRRREAEMAAHAAANGMRIIGPNTDGIANLAAGALATIQPVFQQMISPGPVAVVAQSGATAASIILRLKLAGIGCRYYAAAGNEVDLGLADYLSFVLQDPEVKIVLSYVESIRRPADFVKVAALAAELGKPIALMKVGASEQGATMAAAHTGALTGSDAIHNAVFREHGIIRVAELSELTAVAKFFLSQGLPATSGLGIVSVSGGQAGALTDKAIAMGLAVPALGPEATAALADILKFTPATNPCDLDGQIATEPDIASRAFRAMALEGGISTVVYARKLLTGDASAISSAALAQAVSEHGGPALAVYAMDGVLNEEELAAYGSAVPRFDSAHEVFTAVRELSGFAARLARRGAAGPTPARRPVGREPLLEGPGALNEVESRRLLQRYGIRVPAEAVVNDVEAAVAAAARIGFPVVMKIVSAAILHKTEVGGVAVGVANALEVETTFVRLERIATDLVGAAQFEGVLVQEQVVGGVEMIAGAKVDPQFGPFVLLGLGGVFTELLKDVAVRLAPVSQAIAVEMLAELRAAPLLYGFRGGDRMDVDALVSTLSALSEFAYDYSGQVSEIDLNPVIVLPQGRGVRVVDAVIVPSVN